MNTHPLFSFVFSISFLFSWASCTAQPSTTALDGVPEYKGFSFFGINYGYYPYVDADLADLSAGNPAKGIVGVGALAVRPLLPEFFLEQWGYDIRIDAFDHYRKLGMADNVAFIGFPSAAHRDYSVYCNSDTSQMFANMYEPIWDNGQNNTPINDNNYAALYVYKMVNAYGKNVRFWEVWNEPDFDLSGNGWKPAGMPGNWFDNVPTACEYAIKAPVTHYNRLMRIVYEIVKSIDPADYVCTGGLGYPSFLDVMLRQTDNPIDGSITPEYPLAGGAYFDCLSFHVYPHIDGSMRAWNNDIMDFDLFRNSDAASEGVIKKYNEFKAVLDQYGFDGTPYPKKEWIITEASIPRKAFGDYIGSEEAQRNFFIKSAVRCLQTDIRQMHPYALAEISTYEAAQNEFQTMGMYSKFQGGNMKQETILEAGEAWRTASQLLRQYKYDPIKTALLKLTPKVRGAAFEPLVDTLPPLFILWAITKKDNNENATAKYSLPKNMDLPFFKAMQWNFSSTGLSEVISSEDVLLNGTPVFFYGLPPGSVDPVDEGLVEFTAYPNPFTQEVFARYYLTTATHIKLTLADALGHVLYTLQPESPLNAGPHEWQIIEPDLPNGVYFLTLETDNQKLNTKILKL